MTPAFRPPPTSIHGGAALAGVFLAAVLAGSRSHLVPGRAGAWYGITEPPGAVDMAVAVVVGGLMVFLLRRTPASWKPLAFLLVSVLPLVPALTGHGPLLLAPQGALLALLASAVAAVAFLRTGLASALSRSSPPPVVLLFGLPFVFYLVLATRLPGPAGPQGDEPHYLVMAHSLWSDGDLDLADEFERREYSSFYGGSLAPHTSPSSPRGRLYSIHAPGLPFLITPAYAIAGYRGVQALMAVFAATTAFLIYRLTHQHLSSPEAAIVAWASAAFLAPLPFYAVAVYPETPAALACALVALRPQSGPLVRGATLGILAALPWLHPKLLPLTALGVLDMIRRAASFRARLMVLVAPLVSCALLLLYFHRLYGQASFGAAYGPGLESDLSVRAIPTGLLALLVDRQFGLLLHAPFWGLAFVGAWSLARERPRLLASLLLLGLAVAAVGAGFSMWWGGACPPTRFLVPAVPVLAVLAARATLDRRDLAALLAGASIAVVLLAAAAPRALHNRPDGNSALLRLLAPALDLDQLLPSFVIREAPPPVVVLVVALALLLILLRRPRTAAVAVAAGALVLSATRPLIRPDRAALQLLQAWDPARIWSPLGKTFPQDLLIPLTLPESPWALQSGEARLSPRFDLPPGRYAVRLEGRPAGPERAIRIELRSDDLVLAEGAWSWPDESTAVDMLLPVGARRLSLALRGAGALVTTASLHPEAVLPRGERPLVPWPRLPEQPTYRVGSQRVRATAIDPAGVEGQAFRLGSADHRFAVDAPCETTVQVVVTASRPTRLHWAGREVPFGTATEVELPASVGHSLGEACVVPVRVQAAGGLVSFRDAGESGDAKHRP